MKVELAEGAPVSRAFVRSLDASGHDAAGQRLASPAYSTDVQPEKLASLLTWVLSGDNRRSSRWHR